jgi:ribulose-phosphate 3-epimerase
MGIEKIGFQGEDFDERALDQIRKIKEKYPEMKVSVDGGVNQNTAKEIIKAGADRLVIGSALLNSYDIKETFEEFRNL